MEVCGRVTRIRKTKYAWFLNLCSKDEWQLIIERTQKSLKENVVVGCVLVATGEIDNVADNSLIVRSIRIIRKSPSIPQADQHLLSFSAKLKKSVYLYLEELGFCYVDLPILMHSPSSSKARSFNTVYAVSNEKLYLRKSFDVLMRILSAYDFDRIFTFGHCFRNEHITSKNQPEFEMLSIYANYYNCEDMKKIIVGLFTTLFDCSQYAFYSLSYKEYKSKYPSNVEIDPYDLIIVSEIPFSSRSNAKRDGRFYHMKEIKIVSYWGTLCHIVEEIDTSEALESLYTRQGLTNVCGENKQLLECMKSGIPPCTSAGISLQRIACLLQSIETRPRNYEAFPFSRIKGY